LRGPSAPQVSVRSPRVRSRWRELYEVRLEANQGLWQQVDRSGTTRRAGSRRMWERCWRRPAFHGVGQVMTARTRDRDWPAGRAGAGRHAISTITASDADVGPDLERRWQAVKTAGSRRGDS
jgi:hypothetical protein